MSVRVFAPAKINLTLKVGRPNANGRHPLQSVVTFADCGDWIEAAPSDRIVLRAVTGPFAQDLQAAPDNLVLRAAHALAEAAGIRAGAALTLEKNLPVASGIGGGSSDAAATLKALSALWGLNLGVADLMRFAAPLGGDVPVCVLARPAYMSGEGEAAAALTLPELHAVLVNPGAAISTAAVFQTFDQMGLGGDFAPQAPPHWPTAQAVVAGAAQLGNDLDAPARTLEPALAHVADALHALGEPLHIGLSGSGATMFALAASAAAADSIARAVTAAYPHWWTRTVRLGVLDAEDRRG